MIFVDAIRRDALPDGLTTIEFGEEFEAFLEPGKFEIVKCGRDDVAMFLYTSGSTGRPKGVPLTHYGHLWVVEMRSKGGDISLHRLLVAAPLYHMNALAIAKAAMLGHATVVLLPQFTVESYVKAIEKFRCTWLTSVPTMMALVTKDSAYRGNRSFFSKVSSHGFCTRHATLVRRHSIDLWQCFDILWIRYN